MVRITEELVRKKSEHNERIINTLEELSLHQENIEKIEHISNWCRNLEILLLQSNLIPKIENLSKFKKLRYLNLAINNIERIENLEKCEFLEKLDLTLNFIGDILSVTTLKHNENLKELLLIGNPCTDYEDYRKYVISELTQLQTLDNSEITRSERIKALQSKEFVENLKECQKKYDEFRRQQRERLVNSKNKYHDNETFWKSKSENAPETRVEIAKRSEKSRSKEESKIPSQKKPTKFYNKDGTPLNINQPKIAFKFEDRLTEFHLNLIVYRYLDSNLISVDLEPTFVRVSIKGKIFQYVLPEDIHVDKSKAQRSQTTGELLITMPKVNYKIPFSAVKFVEKKKGKLPTNNDNSQSQITGVKDHLDIPPLEYC
ncbi:hypothetical protein FQA39_LY07366 [Lamprigera yunnana]|nr:hypothetical protein FQA39_LY07366 [Lamprigera yunnana]